MLYLIVVLFFSGCSKYEFEVLEKVSILENLFSNQQSNNIQFKNQNKTINGTITDSDTNQTNFNATILDKNCYPFLFFNVPNREHTNEINITKTENNLILSHKETFEKIRLTFNGDLFNVYFSPFEIVIPMDKNSYNKTYNSTTEIKMIYKNIDNEIFSFENNEQVFYSFSLTSFNDKFIVNRRYEEVLEIRIWITNHTSDEAEIKNLDFIYYFNYELGLIGFGNQNDIYLLVE